MIFVHTDADHWILSMPNRISGIMQTRAPPYISRVGAHGFFSSLVRTAKYMADSVRAAERAAAMPMKAP